MGRPLGCWLPTRPRGARASVQGRPKVGRLGFSWAQWPFPPPQGASVSSSPRKVGTPLSPLPIPVGLQQLQRKVKRHRYSLQGKTRAEKEVLTTSPSLLARLPREPSPPSAPTPSLEIRLHTPPFKHPPTHLRSP